MIILALLSHIWAGLKANRLSMQAWTTLDFSTLIRKASNCSTASCFRNSSNIRTPHRNAPFSYLGGSQGQSSFHASMDDAWLFDPDTYISADWEGL
jgi:hypothetical protein